MLLVIPSIEIKDGKCVRSVHNTGGFLHIDDPIEMAKLWRKENAKSLHVTDIDGARLGYMVNREVIQKMIKAVDIPIEFGGGLRSYGEVKKALDLGAFRVVIGTMMIENPDEAKRTIDTHGASKIVLGINTKNFHVTIKSGTENTWLTPISIALNAQAIGFRRLIYTDVIDDRISRGANFGAIKLLAEKIQMRITVSGGISGLSDLLQLQELEQSGVDSVIIGRALYENKFSCQHLWRICEAGNYPYTAKV